MNHIVICGLGAAGSTLLMNLFYDLPEVKKYGIDYDLVEPRNYMAGTQAYQKIHVGKHKATAMVFIARSIDKEFFPYHHKIESEKDLDLVIESIVVRDSEAKILIVDAFDNPDARNITKRFFLKNRYKNNVTGLLHLGFSPLMTGEVMWDENWYEMTPNKKQAEFDICTTLGAKSFITFLTSIASMSIQEFFNHNKKLNFYCDKFFKLRNI